MADNIAKFTINGSPAEDANGKRGYDANPSENLAITLEKNPATGALTTTYELADATKPDAPLDSLFETLQEFDQNNSQIITVDPANSTVNIIIDAATEISAYTLRATVITATGAQIFERLIVVREQGLRMTTPAETAQYAQRGWSDAFNELTKAIVGLIVGGPAALVSATVDGISNSFPVGQQRIFHSDGGTDGGTWAILTASDMTAALAIQSIDPTHIVPSMTDSQVLTTVAGVTAWATPAAGGSGSDPSFKWVYDTAITGDSATGHFRYDSADTTTVAKINIHSVMDGSINALDFTNNPTLLVDGVVYVSNADGSKIHAWKVTGVTDFAFVRQEWDVVSVGATQTTQFTDQDVLHLTFPGNILPAGSGLVSSSAAGTVSAFATGVSRILWSDGSTNGALTTQMTFNELDASIVDGQFPLKNLQIGTDGRVLTMLAGTPAWVDPSAGTGFVSFNQTTGVQYGTRWYLGEELIGPIDNDTGIAFSDISAMLNPTINWPTETGRPPLDTIVDVEIVIYAYKYEVGAGAGTPGRAVQDTGHAVIRCSFRRYDTGYEEVWFARDVETDTTDFHIIADPMSIVSVTDTLFSGGDALRIRPKFGQTLRSGTVTAGTEIFVHVNVFAWGWSEFIAPSP